MAIRKADKPNGERTVDDVQAQIADQRTQGTPK